MKRLPQPPLRAAWFLVLCGFLVPCDPARGVEYVINISVDGLGATYLKSLVNTNQLPNFRRLQVEGAWTNNARNDTADTTTVANHTSMMTGRGVAGPTGHNYTDDGTPAAGVTIHSNKGSYVASVFDLVHDNGISTSLYANKSKFVLYQRSYDAANGAPDLTGPDNGQNKIDTYFYKTDSLSLVTEYLAAMTAAPTRYSFLHLRDPDTVGHASGWGTTDYNNAVKTIDGYVGRILNLVESSPTLRGKTTLILTADHGGTNVAHSTVTQPLNYTIPFYAWGAGVSRGADLYAINSATRLDPGAGQPADSAPGQPIRNGDIANLSSGLLGLGPVSGSTINAGQDLALQSTSAAPLPILVACQYFAQQPVGTANWTPGRGNVELAFSTTATPQGGGTQMAAVYTTPASPWTTPWTFRMQGVLAETAFAPIDLAPYQSVSAGIDVKIKNATYSDGDFFSATLFNGAETVSLADVRGAALNDLPKSTWLHYTAAIPAGWTTATLKIASSTSYTTTEEAVDFDNIEFYAAPTAATGHWTTADAGVWSEAANWNSPIPGHAGDTAVFNAMTGPTTVTLDGRRALGSLTINGPTNYTLSGGPDAGLTMAAGLNSPASIAVVGEAGRHEIAVPIALLSDLTVAADAGTTLVFSNRLAGNRSLTKTGPGTLILAGGNEVLGDTAVQAGTLRYDLAGAKPVAIGDGSTLSIAAGARVELAGTQSGTSDGTHHLRVINDSPADGLTVSGTNQAVAGIEGVGGTTLLAGASLTTDSIVQDTLTILDGASLTIRPTVSATSVGQTQSNTVPEPGAIALLLVGGLLMVALRFTGRRAQLRGVKA